jgi:hypothetical protein
VGIGEATVATTDDSRWPDEYRPIEVDLSSLGKFAKALRDEVELNFRHHARRIGDTLDPGEEALPAKPGIAEWEAARGQYADGRNRAISLLGAYERATSQIAEAAEVIARRYRDSDQFAQATVSDVHDAFSQAARKYGLDGMGNAQPS